MLAKHIEMRIWQDLHDRISDVQLATKKGYPTIEHRNAVIKFGLSEHHRKSFKTTDPQLKIWPKKNPYITDYHAFSAILSLAKKSITLV